MLIRGAPPLGSLTPNCAKGLSEGFEEAAEFETFILGLACSCGGWAEAPDGSVEFDVDTPSLLPSPSWLAVDGVCDPNFARRLLRI